MPPGEWDPLRTSADWSSYQALQQNEDVRIHALARAVKRRGTVCGKKKREKPKTLNGRLPLEDSSVFDDPVLVLIVMT